MSDDKAQVDGEQLFDTEQSDDNTDVVSNTKEPEEAPGEENEDALDLSLESDDAPKKEQGKSSVAEENRQKQIATWAARISSGERELSEIPHKWIRDAVSSKLTGAKPETAPAGVDIEAIVERKLKMEMEAKAFTEFKTELEQSGLSKAEKVALQSEWQELISMGVPKYNALRKAAAIVGIDPDAKKTEHLRRNMTLPRSSRFAIEDKVIDPLKLPEKKRMEYYEKIRTGR